MSSPTLVSISPDQPVRCFGCSHWWRPEWAPSETDVDCPACGHSNPLALLLIQD